MQNSFIFYRSFFEATLPLNDTDKLALFQAITEYALNQTETELTPVSKAMFGLIKPQLDANHKRYENGTKGGRPKTEPKPNHNQKITKAEPNKNLNSNLNKNYNLNPNKNSKKEYPLSFEEFWKLYPPNGASKSKTYESWNNATKETTHDSISRAATDYRRYLERTDTPTAHATTWLNQQRWEVKYEELGGHSGKHGDSGQGTGSSSKVRGRGQTKADYLDEQLNRVLAKYGVETEAPNPDGGQAELAQIRADAAPVLLDDGVVRKG